MVKEKHQTKIEHEFGRGKANDNALKMVVTSKIFKTRRFKAHKGKGSFKRHCKHRKGFVDSFHEAFFLFNNFGVAVG